MTKSQKEYVLEYFRTVTLRVHFAKKDMEYAIESKDDNALIKAIRDDERSTAEQYGIKSTLALMGYKIIETDNKFNFELIKSDADKKEIAVILS